MNKDNLYRTVCIRNMTVMVIVGDMGRHPELCRYHSRPLNWGVEQ